MSCALWTVVSIPLLFVLGRTSVVVVTIVASRAMLRGIAQSPMDSLRLLTTCAVVARRSRLLRDLDMLSRW